MKKGMWMEFVQVHVRTNLVPSKSAGDRSGAAPEFGLPNSVIRRLFGEIAGYSLLCSGRIPVSWGGLVLIPRFLQMVFLRRQ